MAGLFESVQVGHHLFKNRVVVPPMVCFGWSDMTGKVSRKHLEHYTRLAQGGSGLIVLEAVCVLADGRLSTDQLGIWEDSQTEGLRSVVDVCHQEGAKIFAQIHHAGEKRSKGLDLPAFSVNELTAADIGEISDAFVAAACRAQKTGFDGVELHGAHGYFISQFASPVCNKRNDAWGGTPEKRRFFAVELIRKIRVATGPDFMISVRMGANEPDITDGIETARAYEAAGAEMLHVSAGIGGDTHPEAPEGFPGNWIVWMGTEIRKHVRVPVIVVNCIRTAEQADRLIQDDLADFVAVGRGHLVDEAWTRKSWQGETPNLCLGCKPCRMFKAGNLCPGRLAGKSSTK